ncbi:hypothetical protein [Sphingomonas sp.]|uniref:hypothetical protein n=1 Tax=Sphingomonas sp. TaxID=28214 RepID=UPI0035C801F8
MAKVKVRLTEESFINGCLRPIGYEVEVDEAELGAKVGAKAEPAVDAPKEPVELTPNLVKVGKGGGDEPIAYEVAAIAPTGPSPTAPQALPPATTQTTGAFVAPAENDADSASVAVVPQGGEAPAPAAKRHK